MYTTYVYIVLGHPSFYTGKIAIVELPATCMFLETYKKEAKKRACENLGIDEKEAVILDYKYLGEDIVFI